MSEYANPTGIHRNSQFNQYRAQAQGGIESFDFKGFYTRPKETENTHQRAIMGLEKDDDHPKESETRVKEEKETSEKRNSDDYTKIPRRAYAYCGGLG